MCSHTCLSFIHSFSHSFTRLYARLVNWWSSWLEDCQWNFSHAIFKFIFSLLSLHHIRGRFFEQLICLLHSQKLNNYDALLIIHKQNETEWNIVNSTRFRNRTLIKLLLLIIIVWGINFPYNFAWLLGLNL